MFFHFLKKISTKNNYITYNLCLESDQIYIGRHARNVIV